MNAQTIATKFPGVKPLMGIVVLILIIVALYYLYKFLFSTGDLESKTVLSGIVDAHNKGPYVASGATTNSPNPAPVVNITSNEGLPVIYEGGEYSVNFWIYVNRIGAYNSASFKHVLNVGKVDDPTLLAYLGTDNAKLHVRVKTDNTTPLSVPTSITSDSSPCDVPSLDMQKWVQVSIVLNNKTCDVYVDGKLARSCVLPNFYKVASGAQYIQMAKDQGFGGFLSNTTTYNYALNPEQVWRLYMSGPGPQYSLLDYLKSLFNPKELGSFDFPAQQITPN
jgi:hypothetical protein